ncbi:MAG: PQQ-binding-like beta-propeller repeat protein [Planctomycetes bacterium]|nr:PQQ-binding-like beta-propeller repeat protein [Planctomycetota bacterium]
MTDFSNNALRRFPLTVSSLHLHARGGQAGPLRRNRRFFSVLFALAGLTIVLPTARLAAEEKGMAGSAPASQDAAAAKEILQASGIKIGLCLHLGAGRAETPGLTAALAQNAALSVHGLALDDDSLARARKEIEKCGVSGLAIVEKVECKPLPYLPDLANLVVVEDMAALNKAGVTKEEILRATAPQGVLCVREAGKWTKTVKPRPAEMDEWTHPWHGPDGSMVSTDRVFKFPVGFRWIAGLPHNININPNEMGACRGWVIAGGRVFTVSVNELENVFPAKGRDHYLAARDAWNGMPLWKINLQTKDNGEFLNWRNAGPLAADSIRVYAVQKDKAIIVDAATGQIIATCPTKYPAVRLVLIDGTLIASCWEAREGSKVKFEGDGPWATWLPKSDAGSVEAFDAQTGKPKWSLAFPAYMLQAAGGMAYILTHAGNPPADRQVVGVELASGKELWRVSHTKLGKEADLQLDCAGPGFVAVGKLVEKSLHVLSAKDGAVLWQTSPNSYACLVDGLLWCGSKKYDPKTGEVKGNVAGAGFDVRGCTPGTIVGSYILQPRGCRYVDMGASKQLTFTGARGACLQGMVPANGMMYTAQNNCRCAPGQIYGFLAIGPCGEWPSAAEFEKSRPVEKGPAFGTAEKDAAETANAADWPMFRHDAERSCASAGPAPETIKELWRVQIVQPGEGPVAEGWKARLVSCLTAPVMAEGLVFVAGTDAAQVVALNPANGKKVWTATLGGRIDSAPTIHKGLCLIGCHDGWVYALKAKDGQLAWRTRVAPWERRMAAYGQIESVWPVIGTVLVHEDTAYAVAGRTSESDGGVAVVALDPATGAMKWAKAIAPGPLRMNDMLALRDGSLVWHHLKMDPKTGAGDLKIPGVKDKDTSQGGLLDGTWTLLGKRRSGNAFKVDKMTADILAWNNSLIATAGSVYSRENEKRVWTQSPVRTRQVEAIAMASNAIVAAGRIADAKGINGGFIFAAAIADGKNLAEFPLDAPPTYDGIAIAREKIYVSLQNGTLLCFGK